ncbi:MAG: hypothetical protein ABEI76_06535 [Halobacteriales archaeon]
MSSEDPDESEQPVGTEELATFIEAKYGDRLDVDRREKLREKIADYREAGETVSDVALENDEGPTYDFEVYRGDETNHG